MPDVRVPSVGRRTGTSTRRGSERSRSARYRLDLPVEAQNLFNHPQWGNPVTGFTGPNFTRTRSLARAPPIVQVGARFTF